MKPNERICLNDFYQLHGQHLYAGEWNNNVIYFLNSKTPDLTGLHFPSDEMNALMSQGNHLNKMAVGNAKGVETHFRKHLDKVFFSDNFRTSYEYHGEIAAYDFINSECIDIEGKSHSCWITLKSSSEFINHKNIQLFDPNVSKSLKNNNKALLVSKAVLVHFDYFGIPSNRKTLVAKIVDEYLAVYEDSVNENLVYEAIAVMSDFWVNRSQN